MLNTISLLTETAFLELRKSKVPLFASRIAAGFPSPADDFLDKEIDLNDYLIKNASTTFIAKVEGDSMSGCGIKEGDILIVDKSIMAKNNDIIVATLNGEFTLKRFVRIGEKILLFPENPNYKTIEIHEDSDEDFRVWGVVKFFIGHV